jgi:hypothetical protein
MKPFLILFFLTTLSVGLYPACGNQSQDNASNRNDKKPESPTAPATSSGDEAPAVAPPAIETITANGKTADGVPVKVELKISDNEISGHLQLASRRFSAEGILDGSTVRCWLHHSDDTESYRGNLIARKKDATLSGNFVVSGSAGESVIRGTLSN